MSYKDKPQLRLYKFIDSAFILQAIIDDFQEISFERNLYQAGTFTISINYNIPNSQLFQRGLFVQFGNDPYDFGEIITINDSIGADGKGSQIRTITGYDARYILKRRVIKNMNSNGLWVMTAKGELCLRNLIKDQCGAGAESKRQLPIINTIPASADAIGKEYSVSEQFTNLYEVCKTIATQSEIGWRLAFDGISLTLECYQGTDRSQTVQFSTSFDSLANGEVSDSSESFSNAIYVGGKGQNDNRDIYEGENGSPSGLDRFESWDNQSSMTTEAEYEAEALSMLTQYGQTIQMSGNGLAKCPYIYKEQYDVGDLITVAFSGKSAVVQILSVTEHWTWGNYNIQFSFGKPQNNLSEQLQLMLRKIQSASEKSQATDSVRWYTLPTDSSMPKADVTYNTIGFTGSVGSGKTFTLYLDNEKTGSKTYHVYFKQLGGTGKLTLTTGKAGATNLVMEIGTYVAIIYVDENGNITSQGMTATSSVSSGNSQPVTSGGVASAKYTNIFSKDLSVSGWYKIANFGYRNHGSSILIDLYTTYRYHFSSAHKIQINYGWLSANVLDFARDEYAVFDKIRICYNSNNTDQMAIYVHYAPNSLNYVGININAGTVSLTPVNFETDSLTWQNTIEYNLGVTGLYINGQNYNLVDSVVSGNLRPVTSNAVASVLGSYKIKNNIISVAIGASTTYTITLGKNNSYRNVKGVFVGNAGSQLPFSIFVGGYNDVMSVPEIAYLASSMSLNYDRNNYTLTFTITGNTIYSLKYVEINTEQYLH